MGLIYASNIMKSAKITYTHAVGIPWVDNHQHDKECCQTRRDIVADCDGTKEPEERRHSPECCNGYNLERKEVTRIAHEIAHPRQRDERNTISPTEPETYT